MEAGPVRVTRGDSDGGERLLELSIGHGNKNILNTYLDVNSYYKTYVCGSLILQLH